MPFQLSDQQGKIVLIFFGYTNCPDVCPITLSEFKRIKAMLGDKADRVRFVYITVDPERDTVERINTFLQNFDPTFTGLTAEQGNAGARLESIRRLPAKTRHRQRGRLPGGPFNPHIPDRCKRPLAHQLSLWDGAGQNMSKTFST